MTDDPRRNLPSIASLCDADLVARHGALRVAALARAVVDAARREESPAIPSADEIRARVRERLAVRVGRVINATGVVLHTNLGRAPWSDRAVAAAIAAARYASVEIDRGSGRRGRRGAGAEDRISALTGAEAALVVNNCAAAVLLALAGVGAGKRVLVSRDQLVEIGGGFRIPEVVSVSGAVLHEVGTTNRTHLEEYTDVLADDVGAILWVHHSNFRQVGFTSQPSLRELCSVGPPVVADLGSGAVHAVADEPTIASALDAGAALVCFSGDKLFGGPQAGVIVGSASAVDSLRRLPLLRALRMDKVSLAALEATADDWLLDRAAPVRDMIAADVDTLRAAVEGWRERLGETVDAAVEPVEATIGGGSVPGHVLPSVALAIRAPRPERLHAALLEGDPPVVGRLSENALLLDARTVVPLGDGDALVDALVRVIAALR